MVSKKKYLNESLIQFDKRLLKNFYLNKGYYDISVNSTFAKLLKDDEFELVFNIDSKNKFFFGNLKNSPESPVGKAYYEAFTPSTSTEFKVGRPYNHFQIVQVLENVNDHRATLRLLVSLGYPSEKTSPKKNKISM